MLPEAYNTRSVLLALKKVYISSDIRLFRFYIPNSIHGRVFFFFFSKKGPKRTVLHYLLR